MKKNMKLVVLFIAILFVGGVIFIFLKNVTHISAEEKDPLKGEEMKATKSLKDSSKDESFELPEPKLSSKISVEEALLKRRSVRDYGKDSLSIEEISQLLWAAQGITVRWGGRTAPSAGAL